jgi:hypothetical protein
LTAGRNAAGTDADNETAQRFGNHTEDKQTNKQTAAAGARQIDNATK